MGAMVYPEGRTELAMQTELSYLASPEQFDIATRIVWGLMAATYREMEGEDFPGDKEAALGEAEKAKAEVETLTFSSAEHDLWYKTWYRQN